MKKKTTTSRSNFFLSPKIIPWREEMKVLKEDFITIKNVLVVFGEKLFSGANLIALGTAFFYRGIYRIILFGLGAVHGQLSWLTVQSRLEDFPQKMAELTDALFSLYRGMCRFGIGMLIVLFVVSQLVNYKKRNLSLASFLIMFILFAFLGFLYTMQILRITA